MTEENCSSLFFFDGIVASKCIAGISARPSLANAPQTMSALCREIDIQASLLGS